MVSTSSPTGKIQLTTWFPSHVLLVLALILHVRLALANASSDKDNVITICSAQKEDVCRTTSSFSNLTDFCDTKNLTDLNFTGLNPSQMQVMRLDFCDHVPPLVFMLNDTAVNGTGNCSLATIKRPRTVPCGKIHDIVNSDRDLRRYYTAYVDILERHEFSLERNSKNETDKCKSSYKDWLCSSTSVAYYLNGEVIRGCNGTADDVCLHCPSFNPKDPYGGFMAFQCDEFATEDQPSTSCTPSCISRENLNQFVSSISGG